MPATLRGLVVAQGERGRGYGRAALELAEGFLANELGVATIAADVPDGYDDGARFLEALGYRERRLKSAEYQGGSSAISNLGMYGVREFAAIINPPQATILAVGAARRQAVEKPDGSAGFASVMTVTLSCDHRVVDGATGAKFLQTFKKILENPLFLIV